MGVREAVVRAVPDTFEHFYTAVWPDLFAFAATLTSGDLVAAEDVAQESLARVYARFGALAEPRPYAFKIATNLVRQRWHDQRREPTIDPAVLPERQVPAGHDHTVDAVRRLPARLRDVVLLHYYADLSLETVARLVKRPLGTVKRRLHEARTQLAVALGEDPR